MDTLPPVVGILLVLLLVLLNGFFVAAEFALVSVRKTRIDELANEGNRMARSVQRALKHLDTYIAATQLGITMASLLLGFIGEPAIAHLVEPVFRFLPEKGARITSHGVAFVMAYILVTALHIVFGELAPKSIALQRPDQTSLYVTAPLNVFLFVLRPFITILNATGNGVVRLMGLDPVTEHGAVHSVQELELLVHSTTEAGLLQQQQERMVEGVFDFEETVARKVMTPRLDIIGIAVDAAGEELVRLVTETGHSRLPVYDGDLDNIVGVVHIKDILKDLADGKLDRSVQELMRSPYFVPENKRASLLLADMRRSKMQMAIVRDEYGVTSGLVTIEDLLEEIVGDILDEYDKEETLLTQVSADIWIVDGGMLMEDFNERMGTELDTEDADTLGGLVFSLLGHQPAQGESIEQNDIRFQVEETDGRRIQKVRVTRILKEAMEPTETFPA